MIEDEIEELKANISKGHKLLAAASDSFTEAALASYISEMTQELKALEAKGI